MDFSNHGNKMYYFDIIYMFSVSKNKKETEKDKKMHKELICVVRESCHNYKT